MWIFVFILPQYIVFERWGSGKFGNPATGNNASRKKAFRIKAGMEQVRSRQRKKTDAVPFKEEKTTAMAALGERK
jgi:hypothetical protein